MAEHRVMSEVLLYITHYRSRRCYESQAMEQKTGIRMSRNCAHGRPMAILKRPSGPRLLDDRHAALQAVQTGRCHDPDCRRGGLDGPDASPVEPTSDGLDGQQEGHSLASLCRDCPRLA